MSKIKRQQKKEQDRKKRVKNKLLKKRANKKELEKLQKEVDDLKALSEPKMTPYRKAINDS